MKGVFFVFKVNKSFHNTVNQIEVNISVNSNILKVVTKF